VDVNRAITAAEKETRRRPLPADRHRGPAIGNSPATAAAAAAADAENGPEIS